MPRTLSGKVLEVPVKRILTGTPPEQAASRESLADPAALDYFVELAKEIERHGRTGLSAEAVARRRRPPAQPRPHSPSERPTISFMISFVPP